jgi:hypothetical protein
MSGAASTLVANERLKLLALWFNNVGVGVFLIGVITRSRPARTSGAPC